MHLITKCLLSWQWQNSEIETPAIKFFWFKLVKVFRQKIWQIYFFKCMYLETAVMAILGCRQNLERMTLKDQRITKNNYNNKTKIYQTIQFESKLQTWCHVKLSIICLTFFLSGQDHLCSVIVSLFASSVESHGLDPQLGQTKDIKIGIWCFSTKHPALKNKSTDCGSK